MTTALIEHPGAVILARERLAALPVYARGAAADAVFWDAMMEALTHHAQGHDGYRRLLASWDGPGRDPLERLPFIHVNVFKTRLLLSVPAEDLVLHLYSSGTTGQNSQNPLDRVSEDWHRAMLASVYDDHGLRDTAPCDVLWLMLEPTEAPNMAAVYSFTRQTELAPVRARFNAVRGGELQAEAALEWLLARSHQNVRVRIIGLCPFLARLLAVHESRGGRPFSFHRDSFVLTGGGWKASTAEAVPRQVFIERLSHGLGIAQTNLRDHYGMVEHAVFYSECPWHRHHVPAYARVLVRHPGTLEVLGPGQTGLLQLITPMVQSIPAVSILTTDWAALDDSPCPCGRPGPTLSILGRAGVRKNRGCSVSAAELVARS